MIPRLREILADWQNNTPRSLQTKLGPSEVGHPCARKLALRIANPIPQTGLKWAALLGLWAHGGIEVALEAWNRKSGRERYLVEHRVEADDRVTVGADGQVGLGGSTDNFDTWTAEVVDWKVVGEYTMRKVRQGGPSPEYRVQAHTYGKGWRRKGFVVKSVRIVFLPRWSDNIADGYEWAEAFDESVADEAVERLAGIAAVSRAAELGELPWGDIPAHVDPFTCSRFCQYFRAEVAPDRNGCPGHTKVFVPVDAAAKACTTVDAVRQLWFEVAGAGRLDAASKATLTERAAELQERDAIAVLEGAGLTVERLDT
jgi:hypothetical protein